MSDEKEDPRDQDKDEETAVPLPERDAMSIVAGPGSVFPVADGGVVADPSPADEGGGDKILPPPRYDT